MDTTEASSYQLDVPINKNAKLISPQHKVEKKINFKHRQSTEIIDSKNKKLNDLDGFYNFMTNGDSQPDRR